MDMKGSGHGSHAPAAKQQDQMPGMDMAPSTEHSGHSSSQP